MLAITLLAAGSGFHVVYAAPAQVPAALEQRKDDIKKYWAGITYGDYNIPFAGLANRILRQFGLSHETRGRLVYLYPGERGYHFVAGKISHFGGPKDTGTRSDERGAITDELLRRIDNVHDYYVAMRFNYNGRIPKRGRAFWRDARLLVVNPKNGNAVIVRPVDWGPNPRTKRIVDVSLGTMRALRVNTDDTVLVSFADPRAPLGPVR